MPKSSDLQQQPPLPQRVGAVTKPLALALTELYSPQPNPRIRSHDVITDTAEYGKRLAQCRRTVTIGQTVYRCDLRHTDPNHHEGGIMKRKGRQDIRYNITWSEEPPLTIRHG